MDHYDHQEERLLPHEDVETEKDLHLVYPLQTGKHPKQYVLAVIVSILMVSLASNVVLVGYLKTLRMQQGHCISEYSKSTANSGCTNHC